MCLSAMMMGAGGGGDFFTSLPQGTQAKKYQLMMWLILLIHVGLSIALTVLNVWDGIMELITCLILFWANSQANYCWLIFYILRNMFGIVERGSAVGLLIQRKDYAGKYAFGFTLYSVFCVFYIIAITAAFYTYREYKAFMIFGGEGGNQMGGMVFPGQAAVNRPNAANANNYQRMGKNRI